MLVLTRKIGEKLILNNGEIEVTVLDTKNGQVKIGVNAPKHVSVDREEIFQAKKRKELGIE
jgi:carbon storage regulator